MTESCAIDLLVEQIDALDSHCGPCTRVAYVPPKPEPVAAAVWGLAIAVLLTALGYFWFYSQA